MGNICRSPTAEGVFIKRLRDAGLQDQVYVDSAGTHAYHVGNPPDRRSQQTAARRGVDLSKLRARQAIAEDFRQFDYVLAMDEDNFAYLRSLCPPDEEYKLRLFLEFAPHLPTREVPDPYYGGLSGFDRVLDMVEEAADGLLDEIIRHHFPERR
jgi:protein-tyrosine phosphatase